MTLRGGVQVTSKMPMHPVADDDDGGSIDAPAPAIFGCGSKSGVATLGGGAGGGRGRVRTAAA